MSEEVKVYIEIGPILGDVLNRARQYGTNDDMTKICNMITKIGYAAVLKNGEKLNINMEILKDG